MRLSLALLTLAVTLTQRTARASDDEPLATTQLGFSTVAPAGPMTGNDHRLLADRGSEAILFPVPMMDEPPTESGVKFLSVTSTGSPAPTDPRSEASFTNSASASKGSMSSERLSAPDPSYAGSSQDVAPCQAGFSPYGSCSNHVDCCCPCSPRLTAFADALWLQRNLGAGNDITLGQTVTNPGGVPVDTLSTADGGFNMQSGARLNLGYRGSNGTILEGTYFGFQQWSSGRTIPADPLGLTVLAVSPLLQLGSTPFAGFDTGLGYSYSSRLNNAELNARRELAAAPGWSLSGICGLRYFGLREDFRLNGFNQFSFGGPGVESLDTRTFNNLVGGQLGARLVRTWNQFDFRCDGKAGLFGNYLKQERNNFGSIFAAGFPPGFQTIDQLHHAVGVAGILDLSTMAVYHVHRNVALRGGYQLLYVPGLALAPSQASGAFNHNGDLFLHGPAAGVEITLGGGQR